MTVASLPTTGTLPALSGANLTALASANLTGALPAIDGSALTLLDSTRPSFKAKMSSIQTVTSNVITKMVFDTETWDSNADYDTTLYRFTPSVEGYYHFKHSAITEVGNTGFWAYVYKNGSQALTSYMGGSSVSHAVSGMLYMDGTTDYVEAYAKNVGGASNGKVGTQVYFEGFLAREA
jgi:hypothetical protein